MNLAREVYDRTDNPRPKARSKPCRHLARNHHLVVTNYRGDVLFEDDLCFKCVEVQSRRWKSNTVREVVNA